MKSDLDKAEDLMEAIKVQADEIGELFFDKIGRYPETPDVSMLHLGGAVLFLQKQIDDIYKRLGVAN